MRAEGGGAADDEHQRALAAELEQQRAKAKKAEQAQARRWQRFAMGDAMKPPSQSFPLFEARVSGYAFSGVEQNEWERRVQWEPLDEDNDEVVCQNLLCRCCALALVCCIILRA